VTVGIVFFDVDGTLVSPGSSSSFLAARFGHQDALDDAESRYADGDLTNQQVSEVDALAWRGTSVATVDRCCPEPRPSSRGAVPTPSNPCSRRSRGNP
jgi:phosphoserine phosphatase